MLAAIASTVSGLVANDKMSTSSTAFDLDEKELEETVVDNQSLKKISDRVQAFAVTQDVEEEQELDEELFSKEMELALDNVRRLGKLHQEELIDSICDDFYDLNGIEASIADLSSIFTRIKCVLAEEAIEDEEDQHDDGESDDSDYDQNDADDIKQGQKDEEEDYSEEDDENQE